MYFCFETSPEVAHDRHGGWQPHQPVLYSHRVPKPRAEDVIHREGLQHALSVRDANHFPFNM